MCDKNLLVARGPLRRRQTRQGMQVPTQHLSGGSTGDASGAVPTTGLPGAGGVMPCTSSSGMMLGVYESLCDTCDAVFFFLFAVFSRRGLLSPELFYWSVSRLPGSFRRRLGWLGLVAWKGALASTWLRTGWVPSTLAWLEQS